MASTKGSQLLNAACDGNLQEIQRIMFRCEPGIVNTMDQFGQTALLKACWRGHKSVVRFLLDNNASTDLASRNGFTPLMVACEKGYVDIVNALLEKGANMEATSDYGETALMWASFKGHTDIVHVLLNKGADPNAVSKKKWTALMWASSFGHTGVVLALLDKNAKLRLKNSRNKTARDLAKECQKFDIAALLLRFMVLHDQIIMLQKQLSSETKPVDPRSNSRTDREELSFLYMYDDYSDGFQSSSMNDPNHVTVGNYQRSQSSRTNTSYSNSEPSSVHADSYLSFNTRAENRKIKY